MIMLVTLPALMILASVIAGAGQLHRWHVQADRENADGELIALVRRMEHQRRLEQARLQPTGRHRLRDTPLT